MLLRSALAHHNASYPVKTSVKKLFLKKYVQRLDFTPDFLVCEQMVTIMSDSLVVDVGNNGHRSSLCSILPYVGY